MFPEQVEAECSDPSSPTGSQVMMLPSVAAAMGMASPKTFSLRGTIQGHPLSILGDSGSLHTFLSTAVGKALQGVMQLQPVVQV
jgi:hypothetical protein